MRPRTKKEKAAAALTAQARRYGTLRVAHLWIAFGAGFLLASVTAAIAVFLVGAT